MLTILTSVLDYNSFEFRIFFRCRNVVLALAFCAFILSSDSLCLSMMLPKYVKVFRALPLNVIWLVPNVLYSRISPFPLRMLTPISAGATAILTVFICICFVCIEGLSHLKIIRVHCIPCSSCRSSKSNQQPEEREKEIVSSLSDSTPQSKCIC